MNKNYIYKSIFLLLLFFYGYNNFENSLGSNLIHGFKNLSGGSLAILIDTVFRSILSIFAILYKDSDHILLSNYKCLNLNNSLIIFVLFSNVLYSILLLLSTYYLWKSILPGITEFSELNIKTYIFFFISLFLFIIPFIQSFIFNKLKNNCKKGKL
jgi:hypothetical protein